MMYTKIMLMIGKGVIEKLQPKKNEFENTQLGLRAITYVKYNLTDYLSGLVDNLVKRDISPKPTWTTSGLRVTKPREMVFELSENSILECT